jgi:hypothetical protein
MAHNECVEVVPAVLGKETPGKLYRTQHRRAITQARAPKFAPEKTIVEASVVRSEHLAIETLCERNAHFIESGRRRDHFVGDTRKALNALGDMAVRVDERRPLAYPSSAVDFDQPDLDDAIERWTAAGRLEIEEDDAIVEHEIVYPW